MEKERRENYEKLLQENPQNELKKSIGMFDVDYDAGSLSISKGGFSNLKTNKMVNTAHDMSRKQSQNQFDE